MLDRKNIREVRAPEGARTELQNLANRSANADVDEQPASRCGRKPA